MGSSDINFDLNKRGERQRGTDQSVGVSTDADVLLLNEKLISFEYFMRVSFVISLPILTCLVAYNLLMDRIVTVVLLCSMGILFLGVYAVMRKSESKLLTPERRYRIYQNIMRGFLLFFLIIIIYAAGWKGDLDRVLWSYIFPIGAFLYFGRREAVCWTFFLLAVIAFILFYPHPKTPSLDAFQSFKLIYLMSFSAICAVGFAAKYAIEIAYARFVN
jgi:drug/metabolite transporter (DMT)-like permease